MLTKRSINCFIILAFLSFAIRSYATIYYVSTAGNDGNNGASWSTSFADLQTAVTAAGSGDSIFIASGNYIQSMIAGFSKNLSIYGSFEGTESSPGQRTFAPADTTILNGNSDPTIHNTTAPSTTVLSISGTNAKIIVDGVKITNGVNYNNADAFAQGGGVLISGDSVEIHRCMINHNGAAAGSGICVFRGNLVISSSIIGDNWGSGSIVASDGSVIVNQCQFIDNQAGGIDFEGRDLTVTNTLFIFNQGSQSVGALNILEGTATLENNTFFMDTIVSPGPAFGSALTVGPGIRVVFENNIVWACGGGPGKVIINKGDLISSYNIGQDMTVGTTVSNNTSPSGSMGFVDSTLATPGGLELTQGSPAVNAGDTVGVSAFIGMVDLPGNSRFQGCRVDIGAYESSWSGLTSLSFQPANDTVCSGSKAEFTLGAIGDIPTYQWQSFAANAWNSLGGQTDSALVLSAVSSAIDGSQYRCIITGIGNCPSVDTSVVAVLVVGSAASITAQPAGDTVCSGSGVSFSVRAAGTGLSYQWQSEADGNGWIDAGSPSADSLFLSAVDSAMNNTQYRCIVADALGCGTNDTSAIAALGVKNGPDPFTLGNDTTLCDGESITLSVNIPDSGLRYTWQNGASSPEFQVTAPGDYAVQVSNSCADLKGSIDIKYQGCPCNFYVPSAFTPNGDGKNDLFKPQYKCYFSDYILKVFNRWGQLIFTSGSTGDGWDGAVHGVQQPIGAYVWELSYQDIDTGHHVVKEGTVMLLR